MTRNGGHTLRHSFGLITDVSRTAERWEGAGQESTVRTNVKQGRKNHNKAVSWRVTSRWCAVADGDGCRRYIRLVAYKQRCALLGVPLAAGRCVSERRAVKDLDTLTNSPGSGLLWMMMFEECAHGANALCSSQSNIVQPTKAHFAHLKTEYSIRRTYFFQSVLHDPQISVSAELLGSPRYQI